MSKAAEPFPWKQVMSFGFGVLRLSPESFWSLSMRELQAAIEAHSGSSGERVSRAWLDQALLKHPDTENSEPTKGGVDATE